MVRIGLGQDSHRIKSKGKSKKAKVKKGLVLGGIEVDKNYYPLANSDGDVILHSLCNALSSAIGGNSIGTWADEMCLKKGITDSQKYVKVVMGKIEQKGLKVGNVAVAVEAKEPRLPLKTVEKMKKEIGQLLKLKPERVGITFTSGEKLTPFGKGKAIQVLSIVILEGGEKK
jgi:2-C-methyl-D-erythritol 2,4-cyclodiphosphate synthase